MGGLGNYRPSFAGATFGGAAFDNNDPWNGFPEKVLLNTVNKAIQNGLPGPSGSAGPIYLVVTPPGISSDQAGAGGYHDHNGNLIYGWIGNNGCLDYVTRILSHEVVEATTDPQGDGITLTQHGESWNWGGDFEVCDAEAQLHNYRLNGTLAQSYWLQANQAYVITDGTGQTFEVDEGFDSQLHRVASILVIKGDQLGPGFNDNITLDLAANGGVVVTLNGETAQFDPGALTRIDVYTGGGTNTVNVHKATYVAPVQIYDGGTDTIAVGTAGSVQGIQGPVTVMANNQGGLARLIVNDSADPISRKPVLDFNNLTLLAPWPIQFAPASLKSLTIYGGAAPNTFTVINTPLSPNFACTYLNPGSTSNEADVRGTTGPLLIYGGSGFDQVNVSSTAPASGDLSYLKGYIYVYNSNSQGYSYLNVDDRGDQTGRIVTMGNGSITGLAPATIYWHAPASGTGAWPA
jgi:hypothetical protein